MKAPRAPHPSAKRPRVTVIRRSSFERQAKVVGDEELERLERVFTRASDRLKSGMTLIRSGRWGRAREVLDGAGDAVAELLDAVGEE